jgi:hypothetical protein
MSTSNTIRNISQTAQSREIIKTSPDVLVYLDNSPYINNYFVKDEGQPYTTVSFNDHLSSFQASYDVDNLTPSCSITLIVPAQDKHLYMAPGGNNLIESMMHVKAFAKGYYPSKSGLATSSSGIMVKNTIYYRVFNGVTTHISHQDTGSTLTISIQCIGVLQFLAFTYQDLNPSGMSNSPNKMTGAITRYNNMNVYDQLAAEFAEALSFDQFQLNALTGVKASRDEFSNAVEKGYINKWNGILLSVLKDTRVLGNTLFNPSKQSPDNPIHPVPLSKDQCTNATDAKGSASSSKMASESDRVGKKSPTDARYGDGSAADPFLATLREYLPDYGVGDVTLVNGNITCRLDRIRTLTQIIGFEGYQDIDGMIIFKPPLYNLDVTKLGNEKSPAGGNTPVDNITSDNNPFIVHLSEIESESESEDQAAIKFTRINMQPAWTNSGIGPTVDMTNQIVTHTDIPKLIRFGLREQPATPIPWLRYHDKVAAYAFAVSEMNRQNRGFRTYSITIPMRPELRLGFPMYIPHKDMYGYIKMVSLNYQQGGVATMTITLDTIRKRPMFNTTSAETGKDVLATQPNLVMQWSTTTSAAAGAYTAAANAASNPTALFKQTPFKVSIDPNSLLTNPVATLKTLPQEQPTPSQQALSDFYKKNMGTSWATASDTDVACFRPQVDKVVASDLTYKADKSVGGATVTARNASGGVLKVGAPFFTKENWTGGGLNMTYYQKILSSQPYTDEKGYELVTPFPWGRWRSLKKAYYETRAGIILDATGGKGYSNPANAVILDGVNAFLFAGVSNPTSLEAGAQLSDALTKVSQSVVENTSFELSDNTPISPTSSSTPSYANPVSAATAADNTSARLNGNSTSDALNMFLAGGTKPSTPMMNALNTVLNENGTGVNSLPSTATVNGIGVAPTNNSSSSSPTTNMLTKLFGS